MANSLQYELIERSHLSGEIGHGKLIEESTDRGNRKMAH